MNCVDTYSVEFAIVVFDEKRAELGEKLGNGQPLALQVEECDLTWDMLGGF
jgi:hypothetical protein